MNVPMWIRKIIAVVVGILVGIGLEVVALIGIALTSVCRRYRPSLTLEEQANGRRL